MPLWSQPRQHHLCPLNCLHQILPCRLHPSKPQAPHQSLAPSPLPVQLRSPLPVQLRVQLRSPLLFQLPSPLLVQLKLPHPNPHIHCFHFQPPVQATQPLECLVRAPVLFLLKPQAAHPGHHHSCLLCDHQSLHPVPHLHIHL